MDEIFIKNNEKSNFLCPRIKERLGVVRISGYIPYKVNFIGRPPLQTFQYVHDRTEVFLWKNMKKNNEGKKSY